MLRFPPFPAAPKTGRRWARVVRLAGVGALSAALAFAPFGQAVAQGTRGGAVPMIRDAEIEQLLRDYLAPILKTAGLTQQNVQVVIVNSRVFNAFVMDGRRIFVNAGALLDAKTPNEIIGVLAHEAGHIAGGHLSRLRQELANMQTIAMIGMLMSMGAVAASAATGRGTGSIGQAGAASMAAQQEMVRRSLLSYQRSQEENADRAAVRFLTATGQSARGMHDVFRRMADQSMFYNIDPYQQSHPMARERVDSLAVLAKASPHWAKTDSPELQLRHDMMRAKLSGFLDTPEAVGRRYPPSNTSLPARYARAIAAYRHSDLRAAIGQIDALIQTQPNNAYLHELKGQALLEAGRAREAIAPLRRAASLAPNAQLIKIMLGQALVATNDRAVLDEAIVLLEHATARDRESSDGFRQLALAYGRKGDHARADLASAQAAFTSGDVKTARELAGRARQRFAVGTPGWVKADDIYSFKPPRAAGASGSNINFEITPAGGRPQ